MKQKYFAVLVRYLPVLDSENLSIVNIAQRLTWNAGLWSHQSLGLHWFAKFVIVCFLLTNVTQVVTLIIERHNTTRVFECFSVITFCSMGALKLFNLYSNKERWLFIFSQVNILESEQMNYIQDGSESDEGDAHRYIEKYTKRHIFITTLLLRLYSTTAIIFILTPFAEYVLDKNEDAGYPHILPSWAPLDKMGFIGYFFHMTLEALGSVYCVFVHIAFDCTSVGIMIFICGQFSLLRYNAENIAGHGKDCKLLRVARDTRAHVRMVKNHATHTALCTVIKELDSCLWSILGVYFLVATLTVCSVAVRLNSETLSVMQLVSLLQYMCGTLTQLFLFCRYGDAVFHESSFSMGEGPFGAAWWALGPRVRRELAMLGAGMMLPRRLHAGPFNTLDLPSFVQIVRTAYSYYAVLGQTSK